MEDQLIKAELGKENRHKPPPPVLVQNNFEYTSIASQVVSCEQHRLPDCGVSMNVNDFQPFTLCFSLKCPFSMIKLSLGGYTIYMRFLSIKAFDAMRPGRNCFISMIIPVASHSGFALLHSPSRAPHKARPHDTMK